MLLARKAAWGPQLKRNEAPRKVKVNIRGNPDVEGEEQEHVPGRMVEMLVQGDEVYLLEDGERHIIDESVPLKPLFNRTWPFTLTKYLLSVSGVNGLGRTGASVSESEVAREEETSDSSESEEAIKRVTKVPSSSAAPTPAPVAAVKAGGRRRKGGKR